MRRRFARGDGAPGIPLQLIAAAEHEFATNRQEPAGNPLGARDGAPEVVD